MPSLGNGAYVPQPSTIEVIHSQTSTPLNVDISQWEVRIVGPDSKIKSHQVILTRDKMRREVAGLRDVLGYQVRRMERRVEVVYHYEDVDEESSEW